jgi:prepilin-type N-terminal cleavage/methylation domain-containing protein
MAAINKVRTAKTQGYQRGFTLLQLLIVVALVAVVSAFGFIGIRNVRAEMRVQNSARRFALYLEKARLDSVRRRVAPGAEAEVQTFDPGTSNFQVRMDFDGSGTVQTRSLVLDEGVTFLTNAQTVSFDWRGRIVERAVFQITNGIRTIPVDVSGSGDVTLGDNRFADDWIGEITLADVPPDVVADPTPFPEVLPPDGEPPVEPTPTPTPNGNGNGNGDGNGNPNSTPTPTPQPTPTLEPTPIPETDPDAPPPPCASSVSPGHLSLSQRSSEQQTGTVFFTLSNADGAHTITAVQAGAGNNLSITVSPATLNGSGMATITITSLTGSGNRGDFTVNISSSPTCGAAQSVTVSVGN